MNPLNIEMQPEAWSVHRAALRKGTLIRQPCEICLNPKADAHHDDYSKPLEVRWLCRSHHLQLHGGRSKEVKKIPVSVRLPSSLKKTARKLAKRQHRSLSNLIETLLAKACAETKE